MHGHIRKCQSLRRFYICSTGNILYFYNRFLPLAVRMNNDIVCRLHK
jgi:hypothetical protein